MNRVRSFALIAIVLGLVGFGAVLLMRTTGIGSHEEQVGDYIVCLPFGWHRPGLFDADGKPVDQSYDASCRSLFASDWLGMGTFTMQILTPVQIKVEQESDRKSFKRDHKFPEMPYLMNVAEPHISPVSTLQIGGIPFEKVYWSVKANALVKQLPPGFLKGHALPADFEFLHSFEYRSLLGKDKNTIRFEGGSGIGGPVELDQAERIALSLKRKH